MERLHFVNGTEFELAPMTIFSSPKQLIVTVETNLSFSDFAALIEEAAKGSAQLISTGGEILVEYYNYNNLKSISIRDNKITFTLVKLQTDKIEREYSYQANGSYLHPYIYEDGMGVISDFWYTNNGNTQKAIITGVPASFEDKEYFDIV